MKFAMSKKGDFWDDIFGGLFGFSADGEEDLSEQWLAYKMFEETTKDDDEDDPILDYDYGYYNWRQFCEDGSAYGINPADYISEEDSNEALEKAKYGWREWAARRDTLGLDPKQFETEREYTEAWQARRNEQQAKKREERAKQQEAEIEERRKKLEAELLNDKTIYTYCKVMLPFSDRPYSFRTEDNTIKIGDKVIVPVGEDNKEMEGTIVSVGQYARIGVPFPVEKTKMIIRKSEDNPNGQA